MYVMSAKTNVYLYYTLNSQFTEALEYWPKTWNLWNQYVIGVPYIYPIKI